MIDVQREELLTLNQAAVRFPGNAGQPLSYGTIHRWVTAGVKGVRLEASRLGGRWITSMEAIQRFTERLTTQQLDPPAVPRFNHSARERLRREHGI